MPPRCTKKTRTAAQIGSACLSCRKKKAKCDGGKPKYGLCRAGQNDCEYVVSHRGGARVKPPSARSALRQVLIRMDTFFAMVGQGKSSRVITRSSDDTHIVRQFTLPENILDHYYSEIHPFLPVMPSRRHTEEVLSILAPLSPFLKAVTSILALAPHPQDPSSMSLLSKELRQAASDEIGAETERLVDALISSGHPNVGCVQALTMLSLRVWASKLDLDSASSLARKAMLVTVGLNLNMVDESSHRARQSSDTQDSWRRDMARRTWWTAYLHHLQLAQTSGEPATFRHDESRICVDFPGDSSHDGSWSTYASAIRKTSEVHEAISAAYSIPPSTFNAHPVNSGLTAGSTNLGPRKDLVDIDAEILTMLREAERQVVIDLTPGCERDVIRNQQLSVRAGIAALHIHLHRHQAFPEVALFSKLMCGLNGAPSQEEIAIFPPTGGLSNTMAEASFPKMLDHLPNNSCPVELSCGRADESEPVSLNPFGMWRSYNLTSEDVDPLQTDPWFSSPGGAGALYHNVQTEVQFQQPLRQDSGGQKPRKTRKYNAWGVDNNFNPLPTPCDSSPTNQPFSPGVSLERCSTAAHAIVRLEVLHRSAVLALWNGPPRYLPFCSCGLLAGSYAFLLLLLAIHAENDFLPLTGEAAEQAEGLKTDIKVIVAGLEAYGTMWEGMNIMAREVRAALEAATRLPDEMRNQIE